MYGQWSMSGQGAAMLLHVAKMGRIGVEVSQEVRAGE